MSLLTWAEKKIHTLSIWDFSVLKIELVILGMIIGAYISNFVKGYVWYFIIAFVVMDSWLMYKIFKKK